MKNLKIYKKAIAVLTAGTLVLFSGCSTKQGTNIEETTTKQKQAECRHLTIYFEDTPITFKECDGYNISINRHGNSSEVEYKISKKDVELFSGITLLYNSYFVNHDVSDELVNEESVQKVK